MDDCLGGGVSIGAEQKKESKNTCSNAPGLIFALKLFKATQDSSYFEKGKSLYEWTKAAFIGHNRLPLLRQHAFWTVR